MGENEILILVPKKTSRLVYIFNHLFKETFGFKITFSIDSNEFINSDKAKIHYGYKAIGDELFIFAENLLFERGIHEFDVDTTDYKGLPALFPVYNKDSLYPFDIFAASFYLLSRYEEYLPFIRDKYGRFSAFDSIAYRKGFLKKPLIDYWSEDLKNKLKERFPDLKFKKHNFEFIPSIDVDSAYAYKHKGALRVIGGYIKNFISMDVPELIYRTKVILGKEKDPFNTFDYLFDIHRKYKRNAIFFILHAEYGTNDKNTPTYNRHFKDLIAYIADNADVGIHPSFSSNKESYKLKKEINGLSKTLHIDITKSRQHFLILHMPSTYRNLINHGITDDYIMGYAAEVGFRASTSRSFLFYDLEMEFTSSLRIHPFTAMEGTLKDYRKLRTNESLEELKILIDEVKSVNGTFISLWHNESVSEYKRWKGWKDIYEKMIEYAVSKEN